MTRVDFYILAQGANGLYPFLCRLLTKAFKSGHQIKIQLPNRQEAEKLDAMLWTFSDMQFIPHAIADNESLKDAPIQLCYDNIDADTDDVCVNLTEHSTVDLTGYKRIIEIVPKAEPWLSQSRLKYKVYRNNDCELNTHKL